MRIYEISKGTVLVHSNGRRFTVDKLTETHAHCSAHDKGEGVELSDEELTGYIEEPAPVSDPATPKLARRPGAKKPVAKTVAKKSTKSSPKAKAKARK